MAVNIDAILPTSLSDEQLLRQSRAGDRDAFGRIVERYQSLVCSLAYSACGDLSRSEDLAQETFVTAWTRLNDLREPAKLRAWLCGIVRNRAANVFRREQRRGGPPASLDSIEQSPAPEDDPSGQAVSREEEALLWRALAGLPEIYREPMVLFYRERQSVSEVAAGMDLSVDTVKQRLSRGRAMLREEMAALVESTLSRTRPSARFAAGVLAALPFALPSAAGAAITGGGVVGKAAGPAATTAASGIGLAAIIGPAIGLSIGLLSARLVGMSARSPQERAMIVRHGTRIVVFCFVMSVALAVTMSQVGKVYPISPGWLVLGVFAWIGVLLGTILRGSFQMRDEAARIRVETGTGDERYMRTLEAVGLKLEGPIRYQSKLRLAGLPLFVFATGGTDAGGFRARAAVGWIALGDLAISPLLGMGGIAIAPIALGGITIGLLSLSWWGIAFGAIALGSLAVGWWAFGIVAAGWAAAGGAGAAISRHFAVGGWVSAPEANTQAAKDLFKSGLHIEWVMLFFTNVHWLILAAVAVSLGLMVRRAWRLRRLPN